MDDDLEPITAESVEMRLTLPKGNRQMRLSALAYRWLREAKGLASDDPLKVIVAQVKNSDRLAIVVSDDGLVVDPGNYYCSGVGLRKLLGHPKERVDIALEPNNEKGRLEGILPASIPSQAGGAPAAAALASKAARSEPRKGADESGPPAHHDVSPAVRTAAETPARVGADIGNGPGSAGVPGSGTSVPGQAGASREREASADAGHTPPAGRGGTDDASAPVSHDLDPEDVNAIDAILAEDDAENDEVNPEWLAALHGEHG